MNKKLILLTTLMVFGAMMTQPSAPVQANWTLGGIDHIDYSSTHSFVKTKDGKYYTMGRTSNAWGAMLSRTNEHNNPVDVTNKMPLINDETIAQISVGQSSNVFLTSAGRVLTSGNNSVGQTGNNTVESIYGTEIPENITSRFGLVDEEEIIFVKSSAYNPVVNLALSSDNRVWVWGANPTADALNYANGKSGSGELVADKLLVPTDITSNFLELGEANFIKFEFTISAGFAITDENFIYSWGRNHKGVLGVGSDDESLVNATPQKIDLSGMLNENEFVVDIKVAEVSFNTGSVVLLTSANRFIGWGYNTAKLFDSEIVGTGFVSEPTVISMDSIEFEEGEYVTNFALIDGLYISTNNHRILYKGWPFLISLAGFNAFPTADQNAYYSNPYFIDATAEFPVMEEDDFYKDILGLTNAFVAIKDSGAVITSVSNTLPYALNFGTNANFVYSQTPGSSFYLFIGESTEPFGTYQDGDTFTLPSQTAPEGYYHAGWNINKNGTPYGNGEGINYLFTFNYNSNVRIYPIFVQGVDPTSSSSEPSSSQPTTSTTSTTTSTTSTTTSTTSTTPSSSTPGSSEGEDDVRRSPVAAIVIGTAVAGGLGYAGWQFFAKGASIGGFSYVVLKKWFAGLFKKKKPNSKE